MSAPTGIDDGKAAWLTTLGADGSPHTTPIWYVQRPERLWIASSTLNRKVQNLRRDPRVSVAIDGTADRPHVAVGWATLHPCDVFPDIVGAFAAKYRGWDATDPAQDGRRVLLEITIDRWLMGGPDGGYG